MTFEMVGTTDDPVDDLSSHERAREAVPGVDLRPTWRGDRAVNVHLADFTDFVDALDERVDRDATTFAGFLDGLASTHDYFAQRGCVACDIGVREPVSRPVSDERARRVFEKRLAGDHLTDREVGDFQAYLLEFVTELNVEKGWVTQLHMGPVRNYRLGRDGHDG
jgi:glucuronate isomerase